MNFRLIILLLILINTSVVYSQSNDKRYSKTRKVQVGEDRKGVKQEKKLARIDKREKRKKKRLGKRSFRKTSKGTQNQNKYSIDKELGNRSKKTKTAYDDILKSDAGGSDPILYNQVIKKDAKDAKFKRKVAKKVKKANKKLLKNYNYGREKGQEKQDRVYVKMRKAGKKTRRVHKGKNPTPWIKRIFRKDRGRTGRKKKE